MGFKNFKDIGTKITGVTDPTADQDAATKGYVDSKLEGLSPKESVRVATASALSGSVTAAATTLTISAAGLTIDGETVENDDRILVKDQSDAKENGIYVASGIGGSEVVLTRAEDFDSKADVIGAYVFATDGSANAGKGFVLTSPDSNDTVTVSGATGGSDLTFVTFTASGGASSLSNLSDVTLTSVASDELLVYSSSGSAFVNSSASSLGLLTSTGLGSALMSYIGSSIQAYDDDLNSIAGLSLNANQGLLYSGSGYTAISITAFAQSILDDANAAAVRTTLGVDAAGTDNSTAVTLASVASNYLSLSGQEITAGTVPIALGGTGATSASAARSALGVDAAGTDNSTDVTLSGSYDYLTLSGQAITMGQIDLSTDVTGALPSTSSVTGLVSALAGKAASGSNSDITGLSGLTVGVPRVPDSTVITSSAALAANKDVHVVNMGSSGQTVTLPSATVGLTRIIKNLGTNAFTVSPATSQTIDGSASITIDVQYEAVTLICYSTGAWVQV